MSGVFKLTSSCEEAICEYGYLLDEHELPYCKYCGSISPEKLCELILAGKAIMHGADWKYGYLHKFYVDIVNPTPDNQVLKSISTYIDENGEPKKDTTYGPGRKYAS
jgi:hypothetical protein